MVYDGMHVETTERIITGAIEVHRHLGPGLLEAVYEEALCVELRGSGLAFKRQIGVPLYYKGHPVSEHRPDLIVDDVVIVEIKSVDRLHSIHTAQMLTYLRVTGKRVGLLLNFNSVVMRQGIRRLVI